jgi:hypothetical protein
MMAQCRTRGRHTPFEPARLRARALDRDPGPHANVYQGARAPPQIRRRIPGRSGSEAKDHRFPCPAEAIQIPFDHTGEWAEPVHPGRPGGRRGCPADAAQGADRGPCARRRPAAWRSHDCAAAGPRRGEDGPASDPCLWTHVRDDRPFDGTAPPAMVFQFSCDRGGNSHAASGGVEGHPAGRMPMPATPRSAPPGR